MIQSKTKLLPSNRELAQMCSRAGISDAQEFFPADSGGFNSVYRVSTAAHGIFILKMSPRYGAPVLTHERNMMHTELTAYDLIRSHTSIRVPRVIFSDFSGKCMPCDWFLMEELEGCPLAQMPRDVRQSPDLMRALGEATAQLHAILGEGFGYEQWGLRGSWRDAYLEMTHHIIADAKQLGAEIPCVREVRETLRHFERELDVVKTPCLVHFDLRPEHIFVRQEAGAPLFSAVIDPDCAYWGDPAGDFLLFDQQSAFWEGYQAAGHALEWNRNLQLRTLLMQLYLALIHYTRVEVRLEKNSFLYRREKWSAGHEIKRTLRLFRDCAKMKN